MSPAFEQEQPTRMRPSRPIPLLPLLLALLAGCPSPQPSAQPTVASSAQSSMSSKFGQRVTFDVEASDPEGSPLSFSWHATTGTLETSQDSETSSRAVWTAPLCLPPATPARITVTITNEAGLSTSTSFSVSGETACPEWTLARSMGTPRQAFGTAVLPSGKVLVAGGRSNNIENGNDWLTSAEVYDPATGTWTSTGSMATPRSRFSAIVLPSGKVLAAGGYNGNQDASSEMHLASAEVYDPATGTWTPTGSMAKRRANYLATLLPSGKVLVFGGVHYAAGIQSAELYDPATGTWSAAGSMIAQHWGAHHSVAAALLPSGKVLVTGGGNYYGEAISTAEIYDPATNTWALTGSMNARRGFHTASLLPSGKVLVMGGQYQNKTHATAELYDPETGTWTLLEEEMSEPRSHHSASVLPSGLVLVTAGIRNHWTLSTADVYDPSTHTWTLTAAMHATRSAHNATVLPSGQVLISGEDGNPHAPVELYTLP